MKMIKSILFLVGAFIIAGFLLNNSVVETPNDLFLSNGSINPNNEANYPTED